MPRQSGRKVPSKALKGQIIATQEGRCAYCNTSLVGEIINWDHFVPFNYAQSNSDSNWVAACKLCNRAKSDKIFTTEKDLEDFCYKMVKDHGSYALGWPEGSTTEWPEFV